MAGGDDTSVELQASRLVEEEFGGSSEDIPAGYDVTVHDGSTLQRDPNQQKCAKLAGICILLLLALCVVLIATTVHNYHASRDKAAGTGGSSGSTSRGTSRKKRLVLVSFDGALRHQLVECTEGDAWSVHERELPDSLGHALLSASSAVIDWLKSTY